MKLRLSTAVAAVIAGLLPALPAIGGPCAPKTYGKCFTLPPKIDFDSVPDISNRIVAGEPQAPQPEKPKIEPPDSTPYTGPMIGVSKNAHAPTVGYYWSIH